MSPGQGSRLTRLRAAEPREQGPQLVLVGPMGSGKSTIGRLVANALHLPFLDSDAEIERETGEAIPEIFAKRGEEYFRALEERAIARFLAHHDGVLALGGGAVTAPATRERLYHAPVVRLVLDSAHAKKRIGNGKGRPVLAGEDPLNRWIKVSREREPLYAEVATWALDTNDASPEELARTLVSELCKR